MLDDYRNAFPKERIFIVGNGPTLNLLTASQKERLNTERVFVGSRFYEWNGLDADFYILTERRQAQEWLTRAIHGKAKASVARFWVDWQPAPKGWVSVPHSPNGEAHTSARYGVTKCLAGQCREHDGKVHLAHGKDTPLAMIQVAYYMGFREFFLLGCETTSRGEVYDANRNRNMHAAGIMNEFYARAAHEVTLRDCTPGGTLTMGAKAPLQYVDLEVALAVPV